MKKIVCILFVSAILGSCGSSGDSGKGKDNGKITVVTPTTAIGSTSDDITTMQLTPGKLITLAQVNTANCKRAVAAGMYLDIIAQDVTVFEDGMTDEKLEEVFAQAGAAIKSTGANVWGMHLPYQIPDISVTDETARAAAVAKLKLVIDLSIKYFKAKHFVAHPSNTILTTDPSFADRFAQSRKSLKELQAYLNSCNTTYGADAILCVENCPRSLAYDAPSLLELLDAEGLDQVRICLDTGHALIPLNGPYINPDRTGDAIATLKAIGTRLGTLHIQQNHGIQKAGAKLDEHIQPFSNGLIDWGEFYYELLKNNRYRGCFLYETSYTDTYNGTPATIETVKANYTSLIYPAFQKCVSAK